MMNFIRHLQINKIKLFVVLLSVFLLAGCEQEQQKTEYVAKVNDSYLTAEELATMIDTGTANYTYRNETIRNWINRELLYQQAAREGILEEDNYKNILDNSAKELAGTLLLDQFSQSKTINVEQRDLMKYYEKNHDIFKCTDDSYFLNIIHFNNEDRAIEFRSLLLESDWQKTLNVFHNDSTIIGYKSSSLVKEENIYPVELLRVVKRLYPHEISIVIRERPGYYTVAQVLGKYPGGSVLPFNVIKTDVRKRYIVEKRKTLIENYIKELYSDNEIEVINQN